MPGLHNRLDVPSLGTGNWLCTPTTGVWQLTRCLYSQWDIKLDTSSLSKEQVTHCWITTGYPIFWHFLFFMCARSLTFTLLLEYNISSMSVWFDTTSNHNPKFTKLPLQLFPKYSKDRLHLCVGRNQLIYGQCGSKRKD